MGRPSRTGVAEDLHSAGSLCQALVGRQKLEVLDAAPGQQIRSKMKGIEGSKGLGRRHLARGVTDERSYLPDLAPCPESVQLPPRIGKLFLR